MAALRRASRVRSALHALCLASFPIIALKNNYKDEKVQVVFFPSVLTCLIRQEFLWLIFQNSVSLLLH